LDIIATGTVTIGGTIQAGDIVTINIGTSTTATPAAYSYTVKSTDALTDVIQALVNAINAGNGDPNGNATADLRALDVGPTSPVPGDTGNNITLSATVSTNALISAAASGTTLTGGGDAAKIAPGTVVTIFAADGTTIASQTASADMTQPRLPTQLGGAE